MISDTCSGMFLSCITFNVSAVAGEITAVHAVSALLMTMYSFSSVFLIRIQPENTSNVYANSM